MKDNPFDESISYDKHIFFRDMSEAINKWMKKNYPEIGSNNIIDFQNKLKNWENLIKNYEEIIANWKSEQAVLNRFTSSLEMWIDEKHPELSKSIEKSIKNCKDATDKNCSLIEKIEKKFTDLDKKSKEMKVYSSLCDDVYKMRDEMKEFRKEFDSFNKKMKSLFK